MDIIMVLNENSIQNIFMISSNPKWIVECLVETKSCFQVV